ncbi:hypothetical protein TNCV_3485121 [Trichonephila clavipes]|nr:hypothetical protein TNCV_3485121 [Trichonephila clavipes]
MDHVILNHGQVTWTTPELAPPILTTTPHQWEDVSALDGFHVHRYPTRKPPQASHKYLLFSSSKVSGQPIECLLTEYHHSIPNQPVINLLGFFYRSRMPSEADTLATHPCHLPLSQSGDILSHRSPSTTRRLIPF